MMGIWKGTLHKHILGGVDKRIYSLFLLYVIIGIIKQYMQGEVIMKLLGYRTKSGKPTVKIYREGNLLLFKDVDNSIYIKDGDEIVKVTMQYGDKEGVETLPYFYYKDELYEASTFTWLKNHNRGDNLL